MLAYYGLSEGSEMSGSIVRVDKAKEKSNRDSWIQSGNSTKTTHHRNKFTTQRKQPTQVVFGSGQNPTERGIVAEYLRTIARCFRQMSVDQ